MSLRLATGPVSWGVDFADAPGNPPWTTVLDEIARSGFRATELGPVGYLPEAPAALRAAVASRGLAVGGSFVFQPLHDATHGPAMLAATRRTCRAIAAAGGEYLVVIDLIAPERAATAGRGDAAPRLSERGWATLIDAVATIRDIARTEFGLRAVYHPHAGSWIEFEDEIERLLAEDPIDLCLDTGHSAYAGVDPVALYRRHATRVPYLHLKDIDPSIHAHVLARGLGFWAAVEAGVFCRIGSGVVDFAALAEALRRQGFQGWATAEQDRVPGSGDALADVIAGRRHLERAGFGRPPRKKASETP